MRAFQNKVFAPVDKRRFSAGVAAPEQKHKVFFFAAQKLDHAVGKPAPPASRVRIGLMRPYGKRGVHEQHAFARPLGQIAALRFGAA